MAWSITEPRISLVCGVFSILPADLIATMQEKTQTITYEKLMTENIELLKKELYE